MSYHASTVYLWLYSDLFLLARLAHVQCWSKGLLTWFYHQIPIKIVLINCSTAHVSLSVSSSVRCCECSASLSHWYYEKDGRLFCKKDYWAKFGELCHGCNDPITTGLIMVSGWLSSLSTSLVLSLLINLELQLGSVTLAALTYTQEDKHTPAVHTFTASLAGVCQDTYTHEGSVPDL